MASPQAVLPETRSDEKLPPLGATQPVTAQPITARELRFSLGQMIVMWSIIVGSMLAVFLFGLFTGREQGMKLALETQEQFVQRLPITREGDGAEQLASNRAQAIAIPAPVPPPVTVGEALSTEALSREAKPVAPVTAPLPAAVPVTPEKTIEKAVQEKPTSTIATLDTAPPKATPTKALPTAPGARSQDEPVRGEPVTTLASLANKLTENKPAEDKLAESSKTESKAAVAPVPPPLAAVPVATAPLTTAPVASVPAPVVGDNVAKTSAETGKAAASKPAAVNPEPTKGALAKGWYVQVAAAKSQSEVEGYIAKLKKLGMKVQMEIATVRNVKYYRVMVGPFKNQQAAVGAQKKIKDSKVSLSTPFTKQVS